MVATDTQRVFVMLAPLVIGVVAVTLDSQRSDIRRLLVGLLAFLYLALNLQLVPNDMKVLVEVGGLVLFAALVSPQTSLPRSRRNAAPAGPRAEDFSPRRGTLSLSEEPTIRRPASETRP